VATSLKRTGDFDAKRAIAAITKGTRQYAKASGRHACAVGISGGVDSAAVCGILCKALGPKNVFAYHLPAGDFSHLADAGAVAEKFGCNFEVADLTGAVDAVAKISKPADSVGRGNIASRLRMVFLYAKARDLNALAAGTSNKSEITLGYFTKFGDGGVDFEPIGELYKMQVYAIAKELGVPKRIIGKPPTAGLWPGQTDESELGAKYAQIDQALRELGAGKAAKSPIAKKLLARMRKNSHKLCMPPSISIK
jgi:NAD+ synthase